MSKTQEIVEKIFTPIENNINSFFNFIPNDIIYEMKIDKRSKLIEIQGPFKITQCSILKDNVTIYTLSNGEQIREESFGKFKYMEEHPFKYIFISKNLDEVFEKCKEELSKILQNLDQSQESDLRVATRK